MTGITLDKTTLELSINGRETIKATIVPSNASVQIVSWSSSNEAVAKVTSGGEVTGVSAGTATITAKAGSVTATCAVTVKKEQQQLDPLKVTIDGAINHTTYTKGEKGSVTFNRFPANVEEFKTVRDQIGGEPHGAVALQIMAFEMYRRDRQAGEACIKLNNTVLNVAPCTRRLKEIFGGDLVYSRAYQMAAFLKGATPENGYNPTEPYVVEVYVNPGVEYIQSNDYQTKVLVLEVTTKGKDSGRETVRVLKTARPGEASANKYFVVENSPGLYSQVKTPSFTNPFKGLK